MADFEALYQELTEKIQAYDSLLVSLSAELRDIRERHDAIKAQQTTLANLRNELAVLKRHTRRQTPDRGLGAAP